VCPVAKISLSHSAQASINLFAAASKAGDDLLSIFYLRALSHTHYRTMWSDLIFWEDAGVSLQWGL
jgi:hypothetical protein